MRKPRWLKALAASLALLGATPLSAGTAAGPINTPYFLPGGIVIVYVPGNRSGVPSCAAGQPYRFALDASTDAGRVQLSGLLSAFAMGREVSIVGTGNCSIYGDSESVSYFMVT